MKLRIQTKNVQRRYSISMTPLIDVVFLLMIFFLMTINFHRPEGVFNNELPQLGSEDNPDPSTDYEMVRLRIIMVKESSGIRIYLQDRIVETYTDLLYYLNRLPQDILISIEPGDKVPYKHMIGVYNTCIKSKKKDIVFSISK